MVRGHLPYVNLRGGKVHMKDTISVSPTGYGWFIGNGTVDVHFHNILFSVVVQIMG
jgi:hypothetical protein